MDAIDWLNLPNGTVLNSKMSRTTPEVLLKIDNDRALLTRGDKSFEASVEEYKNSKDEKENYYGALVKESDKFRAWLPLTKRYWA